MLAAVAAWIVVAPWSFLAGVVVGLAAASRYRIVKINDDR
jgi:hypothetical protein